MRFSYYFTVRRSENVWFVHTSTSRIRKTCLPVFTEPCSAAAVSFVWAQSGTLVAIAVELRLLFWVVSVATLAPPPCQARDDPQSAELHHVLEAD